MDNNQKNSISKEDVSLEIKNDNLKLEKKDLEKRLFFTNLKVWAMVILLVFEVIFFYSLGASKGFLPSPVPEGDKVAVINFNKEVTETYVNDTMTRIDEIVEDPSYKEILFIMNSPGGSPSASEELSEYLKEIHKNKKVTMYVQSVAASGGYYIASAIKPIYANKNAIVGSIGVIMEHYNFEELAKKVGVKNDYLAKGEYKKPISFFQEITPETKEYLDSHLLSPMYKNFITSVADNRGKSFQDIEKVAGGTIFLANDERVKGVLIDNVSSLYKVKEIIKKRNPNVSFVEITEKEEGLFGGISGKLNLNLENIDEIKNSSTNIELR